MKWIKISIGVVIAVVMVGFIVTSLHSVTKSQGVKDEVVTFELLDDNAFDVYSKIKDYAIFNNNNEAINLIDVSFIDSNSLSALLLHYENEYHYAIIAEEDNSIFLTIRDNEFDFDGLEVGDIISITFEVPQPPRVTGVIATLLLLTPLIFAGGVLAFMLNKQEF